MRNLRLSEIKKSRAHTSSQPEKLYVIPNAFAALLQEAREEKE
jgi:hypothetical protein